MKLDFIPLPISELDPKFRLPFGVEIQSRELKAAGKGHIPAGWDPALISDEFLFGTIIAGFANLGTDRSKTDRFRPRVDPFEAVGLIDRENPGAFGVTDCRFFLEIAALKDSAVFKDHIVDPASCADGQDTDGQAEKGSQSGHPGHDWSPFAGRLHFMPFQGRIDPTNQNDLSDLLLEPTVPIKFACDHCGGVLSIARRKAYALIDCPKCGCKQVVPSESRISQDDVRVVKSKAPDASSAVAVMEAPPVIRPIPGTATAVERPLFERDDIENLLSDEAKKTAKPAVVVPAISATPSIADMAAGVELLAERGTLLLRKKQLVIAIALVILLILIAFGLGIMFGKTR
jgi:hypothetical protein